MSTDQIASPTEIAAPATLEILWQEDASAYVLCRGAEGELSALDIPFGRPARAELAFVATPVEARRVEVVELIRLAAARPAGLEPGPSAAAVFAIVELAQRSVDEGLVHPTLTCDDGDPNATVLDLYAVVVDQIARDRLRAHRVRLTSTAPYGRRGAVELFLDGLTASEAGLQKHSGFASLERRLSR